MQQVGSVGQTAKILPDPSVSPPTPQRAVDRKSDSQVLNSPHSLGRVDRHLTQSCGWQRLVLL